MLNGNSVPQLPNKRTSLSRSTKTAQSDLLWLTGIFHAVSRSLRPAAAGSSLGSSVTLPAASGTGTRVFDIKQIVSAYSASTYTGGYPMLASLVEI